MDETPVAVTAGDTLEDDAALGRDGGTTTTYAGTNRAVDAVSEGSTGSTGRRIPICTEVETGGMEGEGGTYKGTAARAGDGGSGDAAGRIKGNGGTEDAEVSFDQYTGDGGAEEAAVGRMPGDEGAEDDGVDTGLCWIGAGEEVAVAEAENRAGEADSQTAQQDLKYTQQVKT